MPSSRAGGGPRTDAGPLLRFGLFEGFETPYLAGLLRRSGGRFAGPPRPGIERGAGL